MSRLNKTLFKYISRNIIFLLIILLKSFPETQEQSYGEINLTCLDLGKTCSQVTIDVQTILKIDDEEMGFIKYTVRDVLENIKDRTQRCTALRDKLKARFSEYWQVFEGGIFGYSLHHSRFIDMTVCGCKRCLYYIFFASDLQPQKE